MATKELIEEALSLPVEQRAMIADLILRSLNVPDPRMDDLWAQEALRRRDELRSGEMKPLPGAEVLDRIRKRYTA